MIYYDRVTAGTDELAKLQPPSLGHFGTLDKSINPEMVGAFQQLLRAVGKQIAQNASVYRRSRFCQPNGGRYDQDDAALAWARTHTSLATYLR